MMIVTVVLEDDSCDPSLGENENVICALAAAAGRTAATKSIDSARRSRLTATAFEGRVRWPARSSGGQQSGPSLSSPSLFASCPQPEANSTHSLSPQKLATDPRATSRWTKS